MYIHETIQFWWIPNDLTFFVKSSGGLRSKSVTPSSGWKVTQLIG